MHTDYQTTTIDPEITPYGKIFGVVKYRYQLKMLCESLAAIDVREVEILDGRPGLQQLQAWQENFSHYFLGQVIGKGSYGVVKEVMRKTDSMKFACKIIKKNDAKGKP